ncbi:MAG TPA: hypothetical protein VGI98_06870 [Candidatus Limnocylindrales bacterium]|jgi:ATP-dependent DNA ligase
MPDQLSLRLDPAVPNPPATLRPMLERPLPEPFDSPAHLFEPVWGGVRALAVIAPGAAAGDGEVTFVTEDGATLARTPVDLAGLAARVAARSAVLDGELVVVDPDGRVDPAELARRLDGQPGRALAYLAFDLLDLDGTSLLSQPLERRRMALRRVLRPGDELVAVPAIVTEGRALYEAVSAQGLAAVRARQRQSPYLPGVRSRLWRTIAVVPAERAERVTGSDVPEAYVREPTGEAPVLALIARLPLGLEEDSGPNQPAG